ncbi:MAG: permease-like cell division protein FtsX [Clostridia bacterium]|nr:permease-like cell division protein FtsX [Clostridia bacterium]
MGTISYWFYDAISSMKKNLKNVSISIGTMIATMLVVAIAFIVVENAKYMINLQKDKASKITAYLTPDVTDEQVVEIRNELNKMSGVKEFSYTTKEEAIKKTREENPTLLKGYTDEVVESFFSAYYTITFESLEAEENIVAALRVMDGVGKEKEDIQVTDSAVEAIKKARTVQAIGLTLLLLVVELSVFLIMNSTKLMLYAKRKEISIMKYVGATDGFIKVPFIIQAIIIALIAALVTMLLVNIFYGIVAGKMATYNLLASEDIMFKLTLILLAVGTGIGIIGSSVSMNKYLDV